MTQRRIGILGYDGLQALDLVGPAEAFAAVHDNDDAPSEAAYDIVVVGLTRRRFQSETGLTMQADTTASNAPRLDTMIIPGGRTMRQTETSLKTADWIRSRANSTRRISSVCTGIYGLAPTGLIDGRRVTTHWRFSRDVAQRFPKLRVESNALYIKDGRFYTSAGITAGIDLALAQIEEDHGPTMSLSVARELVVYLKRPGGQDQFSEPLQFQMRSADRFADLTAWIAGHLNGDLSVETLAARACLGPRQFSKVFKEAYGMSPAAFVEEMRIREAGRRLAARRVDAEAVARSVGYHSLDVFRRAFERCYGVSPSSYRSHFAAYGNRTVRATAARQN